MLLTVPDPGVTLGPLWAQQINDSLDLIDTHDHTPNHGVKVPTGGLNINADLSFNGFAATALNLSQYNTLSVSPSQTTSTYVLNGELAYKDALGQVVVLTNNGSISGASGNIAGLVSPASASYSPITDYFTFNWNTSQPGKLNISDISIYEFANPTANPVTIKSPASLISAYSLTLPAALPAAGSQALMVSSTGITSNPTAINAIGMIPIGGIIPVITSIPGAYNGNSFTTSADPTTGLVFAVGQTLADALSPMNGHVIPDLSSQIYLRGNAVNPGGTGGDNVHNHVMSHTHQWGHDDVAGTRRFTNQISDPSTITILEVFTSPYTAAFFFPTTNTAGGAGAFTTGGTSPTNNFYTTGVLNPPGGPGGSLAFTSIESTEPSYINVHYYMRVY